MNTKSAVFKKAWQLFRSYGYRNKKDFGRCLKQAWSIAPTLTLSPDQEIKHILKDRLTLEAIYADNAGLRNEMIRAGDARIAELNKIISC